MHEQVYLKKRRDSRPQQEAAQKPAGKSVCLQTFSVSGNHINTLSRSSVDSVQLVSEQSCPKLHVHIFFFYKELNGSFLEMFPCVSCCGESSVKIMQKRCCVFVDSFFYWKYEEVWSGEKKTVGVTNVVKILKLN